MSLFYAMITSVILAQTPEKMSYQAIVRNTDNNLVANSTVGIKILVRQGSTEGASVYEESHNTTTNISGLVTLEIGTGAIITGSFSDISWAQGPYFMETQIDATGGTDYNIIGISQLLSVPYALHAKTAESVVGTTGSNGDKAEVIPFVASRNISSTDVNNTIECTTSATLTIPAGFSDMEVGDTINLEAHNGATLTVLADTGVNLNYTSAGNAQFKSDSGVVRFGLMRKSGINSYIISGQ